MLAPSRISVRLFIVVTRTIDIVIVIMGDLFSFIAYGGFGITGSKGEQLFTLGLASILALYLVGRVDGYGSGRLLQAAHRVGRIAIAVAVSAGTTAGYLELSPATIPRSDDWLLLIWSLVTTTLLAIAAVINARSAAALLSAGRLSKRVAVIGVNTFSELFISRMAADTAQAAVCVGLYSDGTETLSMLTGSLSLGCVNALIDRGRREKIDAIVIAGPAIDMERLGQLHSSLRTLPIDLYLASLPLELACRTGLIDRLGPNPVLKIGSRPLTTWQSVQKNALDRVLSSILLIAVLPVLTLLACAVRLDSPGPILFRQPRVGLNNTTFNVLKFRSMFHDMADLDVNQQTIRGDPRVTRVGRILRRTSLDEVPQLINVLRGEMSLVGPRPHAPNTRVEGQLFHDVVDDYALRHRIKPGITGWAQVNGWRGETRTHEQIVQRVAHDLYYIDNWCLMLDIQIMLQTIVHQLLSKEAF